MDRYTPGSIDLGGDLEEHSFEELPGIVWDASLAITPSTLGSGIPSTSSPLVFTEEAILASPSVPERSQVCSSCRRKKRKCSLERPSCALCNNNKWVCDYNWVKKRPGPAKGSVGLKSAVLTEQSLPLQAVPPTPALVENMAITLNQDTKNKMLELYFAHIHFAYPIISRKLLMQALAAQKFPQKLLNAMFAVASICIPDSETLTFFGSAVSERPAQTFFRLAMEQHREQKESDQAMSLDDIRTEILLTLYEYTNFPGRRAWMMAGNLVRLAYGAGLHRLDCDEKNGSYTDFDMEERRFVWWSIWKLDSAINTLTSTPFGVDSRVNGTAFVSTSMADFAAGINQVSTQQFLPSDTDKLWKCASLMLDTDTSDGTNMYHLVINYLRATEECIQRLHTVPPAELSGQLMTLRNTLSCLRLALPVWYFEPPRHRSTETVQKHWLRLEGLLILYCGHIQLFLPRSTAGEPTFVGDDSLENWKICVSVAEDIAAIFHHWQPKYFTIADPMISFTVWLAYLTLTFHSMCNDDSHEEYDPIRIRNSLDLLDLALDKLAQRWPLSRLLMDSLKDLQGWAWLKIDFSELLWAVAQLRVPIDLYKQKPFTINMWNIFGRYN